MINGIVRNLDPLGRVTLPKEMRKTLGIKENDPVDIFFSNQCICIKPVKLQCVCCGSKEENKLIEKNGVHMCPSCIEDMRQEVMKYED